MFREEQPIIQDGKVILTSEEVGKLRSLLTSTKHLCEGDATEGLSLLSASYYLLFARNVVGETREERQANMMETVIAVFKTMNELTDETIEKFYA